MRRILDARQAPALVVAVIALVVAAGGLSLAAPAAHHSRSKKISGSRIKKHSIVGNRLRNNTLTGVQINESKLGKVPSALNADNATTAGSATTAGVANTVQGYQLIALTRVPATEGSTPADARDAAPKNTLFSRGPVSVYAKCFHSSSDDTTRAQVYLETSQDGALAYGDEIAKSGGTGSDFVLTSTPEDQRILSAAQGNPNAGGYIVERDGVTAPNGITFTANFETGAKSGDIASGPGNGVFGSGNGCFFHAEVFG